MKKIKIDCVCGNPEEEGVVHRKDGPCFIASVTQPTDHQSLIHECHWTPSHSIEECPEVDFAKRNQSLSVEGVAQKLVNIIWNENGKHTHASLEALITEHLYPFGNQKFNDGFELGMDRKFQADAAQKAYDRGAASGKKQGALKVIEEARTLVFRSTRINGPQLAEIVKILDSITARITSNNETI